MQIPLPDPKDKKFWDQTYYEERWYLTVAGIHELRKTIRSEVKDRHSVLLPWLAVVFSFIAAVVSIWNASSELRPWVNSLFTRHG